VERARVCRIAATRALSGTQPLRSLLKSELAAVTVLGVLADMLDRHHMLVLGGIEYDDALGRAARLSGQRMTEMSFLEIKDGVDLLMIVNC
jgi:hypothetical protein